ncbi:MAG: fibrillarin-like rRNA/tRNA 2'-O-methyltransferase [Candidatus Bathyarchaeota archaeon]|nr:fibrillarin-like rRNA/tRNA 2'-O-methyltransferase [Candidatus Bathyarchaeota archaeon]
MDVKIEPHPEFSEVYQATFEDGSQRLATRNLAPGRNIYGERLIEIGNAEYRVWDPFRSKLAAAIMKGLKRLPINRGDKVLYLGAASGTTASHVSDIVGEDGYVYCVEFAPRSIRDLIDNVCRYRGNMAPILADARFARRYTVLVEKVDAVYCDIAQPEQARILVNNAKVFLKTEGWAMLAVKARSIDVTKEPSEIYKREVKVLEKGGFNVSEVIHLEPYDKAHAMIVARRSV